MQYERDESGEPFTGVILGIRADEEGSRSKERYFSPRDGENLWKIGDQPPDFWNQFKTDFAPGTHVRIHPLLDWTELNVWEYIQREEIPVSGMLPLYVSC
jgi:sulfate adenylyltransferase subunit 2